MLKEKDISDRRYTLIFQIFEFFIFYFNIGVPF